MEHIASTVVPKPKLTLTVPEAAELVGISKAKMYEIVRIEGFPAIRFGKRILVNRKKLESWLDEQSEKGWRNYEN